MNFKNWMEEASMGAATPEMLPGVNRGSDTPASDGVKQTGLQPQVDAQEIETMPGQENKFFSAIDAGIEHLEAGFPEGEDAETPRINRFKSLWQQFKDEYDALKNAQEPPTEDGGALGNSDDPHYRDLMANNPNMALAPGTQGPHGPGIFGQV
jgi:hypothetical protein